MSAEEEKGSQQTATSTYQESRESPLLIVDGDGEHESRIHNFSCRSLSSFPTPLMCATDPWYFDVEWIRE